jgi:hypothetical protein
MSRHVTVNTICRSYRDSQLMLFGAVVAVYCESHKCTVGKAYNCCVFHRMVHEVPTVLQRVKWIKTPGSNVFGRMIRADSVFCVFADLVKLFTAV